MKFPTMIPLMIPSAGFPSSGTRRASLRLLLCWLCLIGNAVVAAPPPVITVQPTNQTVLVGGNATFVVEATSGTTLSYQWYFQANAIPAATNNVYTRANAQLTHAGAYYAAVQNAGGTVNSSNAILTVVPLLVTTTNNSGAGSLRQAILDANADAGTNIITFDIPGAGVRTIVPAWVLSDITDAVIIDGTSQPGYSGTPLIELDGTSAGNNRAGLTLASGSSGSTIRGLALKRFGTDGIQVNRSSGNLIENNLIAFNGIGIEIINNASTGNSILGNSIFSNAGLGIDLGTSGVTANDSGDGDTGPNNLQNFPVLSAAYTYLSQVTILGTLNSTPSSYFRVEFFASTAADGTGYGEGERYLGFANLSTDGSGNTPINTSLTATVAAGEFVSATATRSNPGFTSFTHTSEFASNVAAISPADVVTSLSGPTSIAPFTNLTYTVTVSNQGPSAASSVVAFATVDFNFTFVSASPGGSYLAGVVTWPAVASLASGTATSFTVTVLSPSEGRLTNIVSSTSATADPDPSNNDGTAAAARAVTAVFPPTLLTGRLLPGGAFQMELKTLPDATCTVLASTNLVDWVTLVTTNSGRSGRVVFIDQDVPIYPQRFYRSAQAP